VRGLRESEARMATAADRLIAWWAALAKRWNPVLLIVAVWAVLALPLVWLRGFNSDDGVAVTLAQTAIMDGQWLTPHMFNLRFAERPVLLSWVIALISLPFGSVSEFTARLPIILSLLGGCLLIFDLLRRAASVPAALFGVALFLACPLVLRAYVMTTADLPLAVLLFLAFYVWWTGFAAGRLTLVRWIGIGGVLAFAALLKGPQPVGYFFLGVGAFVVVSRSWTQLPGLVLAGVVSALPAAAWYMHVYAPGDETTWAMFMRLDRVGSASLPHPLRATANIFVETLPASILVSLFLLTGAARRGGEAPSSFVAALACYAFTCTVALLFWPGGEAARYFFPMAPPLCVLGGLAFDSLSRRRPLLVAPVLVATLGILAYAAVYSAVASPLLAAQFRSTKIDAARIMERMRAAPVPIYRLGPAAMNEFSYLPVRVITVVNLRLLETLRGPAWIVVPSDAADDLLAKRQGSLHFVMAFGRPERWRLLRLDD
jgi:4-amino-4-deoxy-L-arabinose transferase-like glycosyltransferase